MEQSDSKADSLQQRVDELTRSLSDARAEIKTLSTKLASSRSAEALAKVPGSALKANGPAARAAANQHTEAMLAAQMKEDLYADLTGLLIRGPKRGEKEDVFD